jgi:hypothetical protein
MLISTRVWRALLDAGITLVPLGADRVELRHSVVSGTSRVFTFPTPLNPSDVVALVNNHAEPGLIIVPAATPAARAAVDAAGWSWLVDSGQQVVGALRIAGRRIALDEHDNAALDRPRRGRPGPVPWGVLTLVRRLIERPYATQRELAELAGISQPRVSQSLRVLADRRLVQRSSAGWTVGDVDALVRWWLESYPGPGGISTFWFGLEPPMAQARAVVGLFDTVGPDGDATSAGQSAVVVSGDVAADIIAPWRAPERAVVYARTGLDLTRAGLTPAGADEATLEFVVPKDPGVWGVSPITEPMRNGLPLADPLQILWDVRRSPGADSEEAAAWLWQTLRRRDRRSDGGHAA